MKVNGINGKQRTLKCAFACGALVLSAGAVAANPAGGGDADLRLGKDVRGQEIGARMSDDTLYAGLTDEYNSRVLRKPRGRAGPL
jgi:hypothetical protein